MTETEKKQRVTALSRCGGKCANCGKPVDQYAAPQYAHRLSNSKKNRAKYGSFFIDHTLNGEYVCSLKCNDALLIDNKPNKILMLLADIIIYESKRFND